MLIDYSTITIVVEPPIVIVKNVEVKPKNVTPEKVQECLEYLKEKFSDTSDIGFGWENLPTDLQESLLDTCLSM